LKSRVNIFPSEEMRVIYKKEYNLTNTFVIEPPFAPFRFVLKDSRGRPSLGIVSRLEPIKNIDNLLNIIFKLNLDIDVHVFGDGTQLKDLQIAFPQVNFHGWVDDKSEIYRNVDLILMYSSHETFNLVLSEAIFARKIIITNKPELFAESFFCEYDNVFVCNSKESFSSKLKSIIGSFAHLKFNFRTPGNSLENFDFKLNKIAHDITNK
jgi:glycosyltransferase involved in cell wall biosynthesis